jgi:hypothetical protein
VSPTNLLPLGRLAYYVEWNLQRILVRLRQEHRALPSRRRDLSLPRSHRAPIQSLWGCLPPVTERRYTDFPHNPPRPDDPPPPAPPRDPEVFVTRSRRGEWYAVYQAGDAHESTDGDEETVMAWARSWGCPVTVLHDGTSTDM